MCRHLGLAYATDNVPSMTRNLPPKKHHIGVRITMLAPKDTGLRLKRQGSQIDSFNELGTNHDIYQESPLQSTEVVISHHPKQCRLEFKHGGQN